MAQYEPLPPDRAPRLTPLVLVGVLLLILLSARSAASFVIEYRWRQELGQLETWFSIISYGFLPVAVAAFLCFVLFWIAHARGMKSGGTGLREYPLYAKLATLALLAVSVILASATVDAWTVVRFAGGRGMETGTYRDPVFNRPLTFYFFELPFYRTLLGYVLGVSLVSGLLYWITSRFWSLKSSFQGLEEAQQGFYLADLNVGSALRVQFVRIAAAIFLVALAARFYLDRYDLLFEDHGSLVGIDWIAENLSLPLIWAKIGAALLAAAAFLAGRPAVALILPAMMLIGGLTPPIVHSLYVRPSEITIQRPFIERHIQATRDAYGLRGTIREVEFPARQDKVIDPSKHRHLLENVRLWDWQAFHDTVTQLQALRPYYVFNDSDVDRYMIDGQLRQVLLTPRELDVRALSADARSRWINPHFIYTHGYGIVMAEAARITKEGYPRLLVQDAPPTVNTSSIQLKRPEIYYGESTHDPVFVRTAQPEFDYPSGSGNVEARYEGKGGFSIASFSMRLAAAVSTGDWNILLTSYLKAESRMMLRRNIRERLDALAGFLSWDDDPYLVVTREGRLMWVVDGYTSSEAHPYARALRVSGIGDLNYVRNAVKATIDAYDGTVRIYVFDAADPVIRSYQNLFPRLLYPSSQIPTDLREHLRYPEKIFRVQAEIYRTYHMTDPEAFFNKEDLWDIASSLRSAASTPEPVLPTYIIASLPGSDTPEFLLTTTFTPRGRQNLIGVMIARCDGDNLGDLVFLQLSKQALIYGPLQIEAQINQDQNISKDLSLWNQQGSSVLRGQLLVLPVEDTFIYIEPIYLQSSSARMPQLKKVVISSGNRLIYEDSYEEALAALAGDRTLFAAEPESPAVSTTVGAAAAPVSTQPGPQLDQLRAIFQRYKQAMAQGHFSEAGKELEALERALQRSK